MRTRTSKQTAAIDSVARARALTFKRCELEVIAGPDSGTKQTFGQEVVQVGGAPTNDLQLGDKTVSRFHLKIQNHEGSFSVVDLGSTNGTYLGSYRIRDALLEGETVITLGNTKIKFVPRTDQATVELPSQTSMGALIGGSPKMRQLYALLSRLAASDAPVIIQGETGTGKELVARVIHQHSPRKEQRLEVLDCTALPDNLAESELFGHVKGAFTGAERDRPGVFERANGGTVFLDELGELKVDLQPKLLRVLETGQVRRVGGNEAINVDVRLVAATHRPLREMVNKGTFREDLYYRLAVCEVHLPPLRDRRGDIPVLVSHFLERMGPSGPETLPPELVQRFAALDWPGNVRQLRNAVERAAIMGDAAVPDGPPARRSPSESTAPVADIDLPLKDAKAAFERNYLVQLLERHDQDVEAAARAAELHPKSLTRLLRRYGIERSFGPPKG